MIFFIDEDCGHEFTVKIANKIVVLMNKIIKGYDKPALHLNDEDVKDVDPEYLKCHTSNKVNTFSLNWDEAKRLEKTRTFIESPELERECLRGYAIKILSLNEEDTIPRAYLEQKNVQKVWVHDLQMIDLCIKEDIHIPSILVKRSNLKKKSPALLFIDENGKWESLKQNGPLTRAARFLDRTENNKEPMILSMDLSGWGELRPQPNAYDLASWSNVESSMAFMAIACNKPIMGLRVRDALAGLNYLKNHSDVLEEDIMVGGRGAGAIVALLAALINGKVSKIICIDMLSHYGSIASEYLNCWKDDILIPDILKYFDLPEILAALKGKDILVLNPLDASRRQIEAERAHVLYDRAINGGLNILCGLQEKQAEESFIQFIYR